MEYEMIRGPFMLIETVAMLYKYVNGISFQSVTNKQKFFMDSATFEVQTRKMKRLQEIMEELCAELNPEDELLQWYFSRKGTEREYMSLASLMVNSFCTLKKPDYRENVEEILTLWDNLQQEGYWISSWGGFSFSNGKDCPGDLFEQVRRLNFPGDFLMKIYGTFRDFKTSFRTLTDYMAPLAEKLEKIYRQEDWLFQVTEEYWQAAFEKLSPLQFVANFAGEEFRQGAGEKTVIAVSLMNTHQLLLEMEGHSPLHLKYNMLCIGGAIPYNSSSRSKGGDLETLSTILKAFSDKRRLEILRRLSRGASYGLELADLMGMDSGNMSRTLAQLHSYGFLREEKDRLRVYYRTDRDVIHNFLELVETAICDP